MKSEAEAIDENEWLLRRVHRDYFHENGILDIAFKPRTSGRDPDNNGISLFRQVCLNDPIEILSFIPDDRKPDSGIVRIPARIILEIGLTIAPDIDHRIPGHVVIPELNSLHYQSNKLKCAMFMSHLASIASEPANILLRPAARSS